ncbi:lysine-specific demethylase 5A-like isoform X3 [Apostichopus japonicus]|uniref:lysine-specific demethylase 5A-like isoform X3 n=1 Tax=Stichopus japonicus TaxID=307972 RepID=UPI003AB788E3
MVEEDVRFVPPPEAPVYEPTEEEFADPLAYIAKIRPEAEQCGICKIRPPPDWQPPFAVDVDHFKFVPRVQRLNELEAKTRVKLNFLDSIAKFWELQGCRLKLPYVNGKSLDLYNLTKLVNKLGGFEVICRDKKWSKVATEMGYPSGKNIGHQLGKHYERILWPYDVFQSGIPLEEPLQPLPEGDGKDKDYVPHGIISRQAIVPNQSGYSRRSKRQAPEGLSVDITNNSELKKLQLYGPGPKFQGLGLVVDTSKKTTDKTGTQEGILEGGDRHKVTEKLTSVDPDYQGPKGKRDPKSPKKSPGPGSSMQMRQRPATYSLIETYICHMCGKGDAEDCLLLCDGCDDSFHTFCLLPPLPEVPKGDWRCPKCLAVACSKKKDPFGFEQAGKEYTLESFGKMADQFKKDYFNMPVHMVPPERIEKEFWRLVTTIDEDVAVQYGADIHSLNQGSGFPTKNTKNLAPEDEEYVHSGWNLNNLPVQDASVLHHINVDISGMKIPWMYVGMCFSAFCWHNEDHWSYSINYLHWGEPKTWYGVSGKTADMFESIMKEQAPELFSAQPDLLHQLVTIMSPSVLMKHNLPIYKTNQCAGEFVITFPRAYHAGFNQGYNFAEAVNFCPVDWLPMGRSCIEHYRKLHRFCVFSHEELIAKMAANPDNLDLNLAAAVHKELLAMVEVESKLRKKLLERGTMQAEREAFELLPDDERQCDHCKTTCFLSAVTCPCTPNKLVCIHHVEKLCDCHPSKHCLRYRYTLDELPAMLQRLKVRAESFDNWANRVRSALNPSDVKLDIAELKELLEEADEKNFPENDSLQELINAIAEAEKCSMIAVQLINKKQKQKNMSGDEKFITRINLDELKGFVHTVESLPCFIEEAVQLGDFLQEIENFITEAQETLEDAIPNSEKLQKLLDKGNSFDIELSEIPKLKQELIQAKWLDEVRNTLSNSASVTLDLLRKLIDSGVNLAPHPAIEKAMTELQELLSVSERWEEKAKICLNAKPPHMIALVEALISESENIPAVLPNTLALKDALRKAKEWNTDIEELQNGDHFPYLDHLETMVNKGRPIPIRLEQIPLVESQVTATRSWRDRTARTFLKKNTHYTLIEVLTPRSDVGSQFMGKIRKKKSIFGDVIDESLVDEGREPPVFLGAYKKATDTEITSMKMLRDRNRRKQQSEEDGLEQAKYCVCKKPVSGHMLRCELCKDWFHTLCVPVPKSVVRQTKQNPLSAQGQGALQGPQVKETKFMCPLCMRSRRPKLETILSLLVSLQKLPVRLPEGESLQCLTERAMSWQDKAKQILATEEVTGAFAQLAFMVDKEQDAGKKEKYVQLQATDVEDPYTFPQEAAYHDSNLHRKSVLQGLASVPQSDNRTSDDYDLDDEDKLVIDISSHSNKDIGLSAEHAYSSMSRTGPNPAPAKKHSRKTPHTVRQTGSVKIELSPVVRAQLEELLIEGDLLEVSLEETQHIWQILKAAEPAPVATKMMEHFISHLTEEAYDKMMKVKAEHKQKRSKRKLSQEVSPASQEMGGPESKKKKKKKDKEKNDVSKEHVKSEGKKKTNKKAEKVETKLKIPAVKKEKEKEDPLIVVDGDEEDDEICSAKRCLQPAGDDINWVQCDCCEKWYHLLCIGMTSQPSEDEEYICKICVKRRAAQKAKQRQRAKLAAQKIKEEVEAAASTTTGVVEKMPTPTSLETDSLMDVKPDGGLVPVALMRVENAPVKEEIIEEQLIKEEPMEVDDNEMTRPPVVPPKPMEEAHVKVADGSVISKEPTDLDGDAKEITDIKPNSDVPTEDAEKSESIKLPDTTTDVVMEDLGEEDVVVATQVSGNVQQGSEVTVSEVQIPQVVTPSQIQDTPLEMSIPSSPTVTLEKQAQPCNDEQLCRSPVDNKENGELARTIVKTDSNSEPPAVGMSISATPTVAEGVPQLGVVEGLQMNVKEDEEVMDFKRDAPVILDDQTKEVTKEADSNVSQTENVGKSSSPEPIVQVERIETERAVPSPIAADKEIVESVAEGNIISATTAAVEKPDESLTPVAAESQSRTFCIDLTESAEVKQNLESKVLLEETSGEDKGMIPLAVVHPESDKRGGVVSEELPSLPSDGVEVLGVEEEQLKTSPTGSGLPKSPLVTPQEIMIAAAQQRLSAMTPSDWYETGNQPVTDPSASEDAVSKGEAHASTP